MKHVLMLGLVATLFTLPALAALKEGDMAPDFKIPASYAGKAFDFSLTDSLKKGPVVVYFYESAYSGDCNIQAHAFSVNSKKFSAAGAKVIGVSLDSASRLHDFSMDPDYCARKLAVGSDPEGKVAHDYDLKVTAARVGATDTRGVAINHGLAERVTFVITPDGKIAATLSGLAPEANVEKTLEVVQKLAATKKKK